MSDETYQRGENIATIAAQLAAITHRLTSQLRSFEESGEWFRQGFRTCAQWMSWRIGSNLHTAREQLRVAKALGSLPAIDESFRQGQVSYSKVRAMTRIATPENETILLEEAKLLTASQTEALCAKYRMLLKAEQYGPTPDDDESRRVTRRTLANGMVEIKAVVHADEAKLVWSALDRIAVEMCRERTPRDRFDEAAQCEPVALSTETDTKVDARVDDRDSRNRNSKSKQCDSKMCISTDNVPADPAPPSSTNYPPTSYEPDRCVSASTTKRNEPKAATFDRASALVAMAQAVVRGVSPERSPTEILLTIPASALTSRLEDRRLSLDEVLHGNVPAEPTESLRRIACDAGIVPVLVDDATGRPLSAGRKLRTFPPTLKRLLLARDGKCAFPGCTTTVFLEGHHPKHWALGGETSLENGCLLCHYHHRFVHEYRYSVTVKDGVPEFRDDRGRVVAQVPPMPKPSADWSTYIDPGVDIRAELIGCYDGTPVDHGELVQYLIRADGL